MNYFNLKEKIISEDLWSLILHREQNANYTRYITHNGTPTDLFASLAYPSKEAQEDLNDPLNIFIGKFNSKLIMPEGNMVAFIKFNKGCGIFPHIDDAIKRTTTFSWAVNLDPKRFVPILYHNPDNRSEVIDKGYYKEEGIVFNTQNVHSVEPSDNERITLQISFANPIDEVYELYIKGELLSNF